MESGGSLGHVHQTQDFAALHPGYATNLP